MAVFRDETANMLVVVVDTEWRRAGFLLLAHEDCVEQVNDCLGVGFGLDG